MGTPRYMGVLKALVVSYSPIDSVPTSLSVSLSRAHGHTNCPVNELPPLHPRPELLEDDYGHLPTGRRRAGLCHRSARLSDLLVTSAHVVSVRDSRHCPRVHLPLVLASPRTLTLATCRCLVRRPLLLARLTSCEGAVEVKCDSSVKSL